MSVAKRIVLIGATGIFGSQLARGLATIAGVKLTLTSRTLARAQVIAAPLGADAEAFNRIDDAAAFFARAKPWLVIDASGPFQGSGYDLPRAALQAGAHWLDLADARDYILGFGSAIDAEARTSGLVALTGVSTTPALSGAVVRALTQGWRRVDTIDTAVLPGGSSLVGASVLAAILARAGLPMPAFSEGGTAAQTGWGSARLVELPGVGKRWASPVEVADPELFAPAFGVQSRVAFSAGLENRLEHFGLMALASARRVGFLRRPERLAGLLERARRVTAKIGRDTGGMTVSVSGLDAAGRWRKLRWTLLAHRGQGPAVPTLPALALARQMARGALPAPGARPAHLDLELAAIEAEMAPYAMETQRDTLAALDTSLFETALGAGFATLPKMVQRLHGADAAPVWRGRASVTRGRSPFAWLIGRVVGFPPASPDVPVTVTLERDAAGETWSRNFGGRRFSSRLTLKDGGLREAFGPLSMAIGLQADAAGIAMPVTGWHLLSLPMPGFLAPRSEAFETQDAAGVFHFDVRLSLPFGLALAHYKGWLAPVILTLP